MKSTLLLKYVSSVLAFSLALSAPSLQAADSPQKTSADTRYQVVFQVSDDDAKKWNLALNNVKNVQQDLGAANVDVEVVVYGPGIGMLKFDSAVANRVDDAVKAGVKIVACENTMKAQKLGKADMMSSIAYVPAGVIELIQKQKNGYAYIRP
jgi:intracellular sulfur oxidation DsrE/DsrF family protein